MDRLLGSIIDDYNLFRIIQTIIIILILFAVYLAIQITLTWKFLKKGDSNSDEIISNKGSFYKNTIFIFIAGFFMLLHEFFEGFGENAPDETTYEFFELMAVSGLVLFMIEWHKILKKLKRRQKAETGQLTSDLMLLKVK
jgi:hypothetical protein